VALAGGLWIARGPLPVRAEEGEEAPATRGPRIVFEETEFNFGEMYQQQEVSHTFTFTNAGDEPLLITDIVRTCGCTAATGGEELIQPGEEGTIEVTFESGTFLGLVDKVIKVLTNDPENAEVRLHVTGKVLSAVVVSPTMIYVRDAMLGDRITREFTIESADGKPLAIRSVSASSDALQVRYEPVPGREGVAYRFTVEFEATPPTGVFHQSVEVLTDHPKQPRIVVPVSGRIMGHVSISPAAVLFRVVDPENVGKKRVTISKLGEGEFEITGVSADLPNLETELTPIEPGKSYELEIRLAPPIEGRRIEGTITVQTNVPGEEELSIPVRALVSPHLLPPVQPGGDDQQQ
jgi:hypothetical protein